MVESKVNVCNLEKTIEKLKHAIEALNMDR